MLNAEILTGWARGTSEAFLWRLNALKPERTGFMSDSMVVARVLDGSRLECKIVTPRGLKLVLVGMLEDLKPDAEGAEKLQANVTLVDNSWAYAKFHYWSVALETVEEQISAQKQAKIYRRNARWIAELVDEYGDIKRFAWCSACFVKAEHQQVARPLPQIETYLCGNCGSATSPCRVPRCRNMAERPPRSVKIARNCAEHRHDIPDFEKANDKIESLESYEDLFVYRRRNAAKLAKIASGSALGLAAVATGAFALAPAVGGAIGTLIGGYSGAAATSYGLALFGGGSIAAGGLGMIGGTYVVAALGAALGTSLGLTVTNAYLGEDKSFRIEKLRNGEGPAVVLASGFLTQSQDGWSGWQHLVDSFYPAAPVYRVHWGAKELKALGVFAGEGVLRVSVAQVLTGMAARATRVGAKRLGPLGLALAAADLAKNPWHVAKNRADKTGAILAELISRTGEEEFVLMGHSLGARVVAVAAQGLGSKVGAPKVKEVRLFGAAIGAFGEWHTLNSSVQEVLYNYFSGNDNILKLVYTTAQLGEQPAGLIGFRDALPRMRNEDLTEIVKGHSGYFDAAWVESQDGK